MPGPLRLLLGLCLPLLLLACQAGGSASTRVATAPVASAPEFYVEVEGIREYRLPNGLRVVLVPDASQPRTTVNITYFVGSRHEGYGESGMAHLLEHLLFMGTPNFPDINREISERGGRANGTTWFDRTNYFQTFPASEDNLDWALRMEADRMVNSFVRAEDLASEMTVVRNEFEAGENNPFSVLMQRVLSTAYLWHGYGRSTIGARSDIENVPIERLRAFYRKYYQPDNAMLVIAGRFDPDDALARVGRHFGPLSRPDRSGELRIWPTYTREPPQDGERKVVLRRVGDTQMVMASYHIPAGSHPDAAAVSLLSHVIGNAPSGRLHRALVETGLAASVGAFAFTLAEPSPLLMFAQVRNDQDLEAVREAFVATLDAVAGDAPPTEEELERARAAALRGFELLLNDSAQIGISLTEWAATGDWRLMFLFRDWTREATVEDLRRVAAAYLKPSNRTLGLFIPESAPRRAVIPEAPELAPLLAGYTGDPGRAEGEAFEATVENIEARLKREVLDNGLALGLLPKQTRGGRVVGTLVLPQGDLEALSHRGVDGDLAAAMLMRGTRQRSRQGLQDEIARLNAVLSVGGSAQQLVANFEATRETLPEVLALLAEILREPAFDAAEFEELRRARLAALESRRSEPEFAAFNAMNRHFDVHPPGHPNHVPTLDESLAALERARVEDAARFHAEISGISPGSRLVLIGDFDPQALRAQIVELFEDWIAARPFVRIPGQMPKVPVEPLRQIETPDKTNAILVGRLPLPLRDDHPDLPALAIGNYMIGGGFLNSRLSSRIRTAEGISYGVSSSLTAHPLDENGAFGVFAMFAPENRDRLLAALREELDRVLAEGFTQQELDSARTGWLQAREVARANDPELAGAIAQGLYLGRDLFHAAEFEARVLALTPEQVLAALRRHIDPERMSLFIAGDFAGAGLGAAP